MAKNIYTILGATGHIGHVLTEELLKRGHQVRALGRDQKKLNILKTHKAEIHQLEDFTDIATLTKAFTGSNAVFSFIPPMSPEGNYSRYQDKVGEAITEALKKANVPYVLNLSSVGAELAKGVGPIAGLNRQEQRLNALKNTQIVHLRPGYFMENLLNLIPSIHNDGTLAYDLRGNLPLEMVATRDIGLKAAELLDRLDFKGHTIYEFAGPKAVTLDTAATILGKAIDKKDLKYVKVSDQDLKNAMLAMGLQADFIDLLLEMGKAFNEGKIKFTKELAADHRGKTTLEQFSKTFAEAYNQPLARI